MGMHNHVLIKKNFLNQCKEAAEKTPGNFYQLGHLWMSQSTLYMVFIFSISLVFIRYAKKSPQVDIK